MINLTIVDNPRRESGGGGGGEGDKNAPRKYTQREIKHWVGLGGGLTWINEWAVTAGERD